jgi:biopolymer transport protein ExbD
VKLTTSKQEAPDVNLTPMIDVVFLLLLFFMVSTSFIRESSLKVDLPEATGEAMAEQIEPIDIIINSAGIFTINQTELLDNSREAISEALKAVVGEQTDPHIVISADADTDYQNIVTAMDTAQALGYSRLTLATRQKQSPK